jgi:hypothetical protein
MGYPAPFRLKYAWLPPPPVHAAAEQQQQRHPAPPNNEQQQQRHPAPPNNEQQQQRHPAPPNNEQQQQRHPAPPNNATAAHRTTTTSPALLPPAKATGTFSPPHTATGEIFARSPLPVTWDSGDQGRVRVKIQVHCVYADAATRPK